jgi:Rod binding domain-containing protein
MTAVSGMPDATALTTEKPDPERLIRAAHQFEAVLLNQILGSLEDTFSTLGEQKTEAGSNHYKYLGVQALASSIAAKGGIGIADVILRNFRQRGSHDLTSGQATKSLSNDSSERLHVNFGKL